MGRQCHCRYPSARVCAESEKVLGLGPYAVPYLCHPVQATAPFAFPGHLPYASALAPTTGCRQHLRSHMARQVLSPRLYWSCFSWPGSEAGSPCWPGCVVFYRRIPCPAKTTSGRSVVREGKRACTFCWRRPWSRRGWYSFLPAALLTHPVASMAYLPRSSRRHDKLQSVISTPARSQIWTVYSKKTRLAHPSIAFSTLLLAESLLKSRSHTSLRTRPSRRRALMMPV